jgi:hypothetical protein
LYQNEFTTFLKIVKGKISGELKVGGLSDGRLKIGHILLAPCK